MADLQTVKIRDLIETQQVMTTDYMVLEKDTGTFKCQARYLKGATGLTPNVQVGNTTTLAPGQLATVTQRGNAENPVFDFGIPQGLQGPQGIQGPQGNPGSASIAINDNTNDTEHAWSGYKVTSEISKVMNGIEDMQGVKYSTDKGYLVMNGTKNGVVKDLKVLGKSLINLSRIKGNVNSGGHLLKTTKNLFKPNTEYTQIINIKTNTLSPSNEINAVGVINESNTGVVFPQVVIQKGFTGSIIKKSTTPSDLNSVSHISSIRSYAITTSGSMEIEELILEGDYTQNPPSYFEGIASVGNGNGIEVLSRKEDGNLFDGLTEKGALSNINGSETTSETQKRNLGFIKVEPNLNYKLLFDTKDLLPNGKKPCMVVLYDNNYNFIKSIYDEVDAGKFFTTSNCAYIRFRVPNDATNIVFSKFSSSIVDFKQDKKPILFKDTDGNWKPILSIRGIDENNCDIVDSVNNKFYENITEIIFNGDSSENWSLQKTENGKSQFTMSAKRIGIKPNSKILSDKYNNITSSQFANMEVGIFNGSAWGIVVSDPSITDVQSLKTKLQSNNVKINVQLIEGKQYEVNPLDLQSFENETMILIESGPISPTSELYVDSNLGSLMVNTLERMSRIENELFKPILVTQMAMLAGDYRTAANILYPQDFVENVDDTVDMEVIK